MNAFNVFCLNHDKILQVFKLTLSFWHLWHLNWLGKAQLVYIQIVWCKTLMSLYRKKIKQVMCKSLPFNFVFPYEVAAPHTTYFICNFFCWSHVKMTTIISMIFASVVSQKIKAESAKFEWQKFLQKCSVDYN